jgi:tetratricopeptide (TPR) repeat protein
VSGQAGGQAGPGRAGDGSGVPVRVFVSYAHDDEAHVERVRGFWWFLRGSGVDARLDLPAAEQRQDWGEWMTRQVRDADRVLVIASPEYKRRAEGDAEPGRGRGVQWEARLIRDRFYADQDAGLQAVVPVVLPGGSAGDIPLWLGPASTTHYTVSEFTVAGAKALLRLLTSQPGEEEPPLGAVPVLAPHAPPGGTAAGGVGLARPGLRTQVLIEAQITAEGDLVSVVWVAGTQIGQRRVRLPEQVNRVWTALELPPAQAAERMAGAGRLLGAALVDEAGGQQLAALLHGLPPGDQVEVVLAAAGPALPLPVELIRLATGAGVEVGPLGLLPGVSVSRRPAAPGKDGPLESGELPPTGLAGPLKVLAAVAAPDETKTANVPLDVEAEMQAVLDAVTDLAGHPGAQVRILEVASLAQIRQALDEHAYHVLHLSAHGSPQAVELEDEDGSPVQVSSEALMNAVRHAGKPVPLIVLSSCSGGATGSQAMAAGLLGQGADKVIAMLATVSDDYATTLARHLYRELAAHPDATAGQALARARYLAEEDSQAAAKDRLPRPEYGLPTLLTAAGDGPLIDPAAPTQPLPAPTQPPTGKTVRDLPVGALIGRRPQLRAAMAILRRTPEAVEEYGAAAGVQLTGIGGIGKTALAGRIISRLRGDGWLIAIHDGRWNPTALITAVAAAIHDTLNRGGDDRPAGLQAALALLTDPAVDDPLKLATITGLLDTERLLVVFDDFEQNLTPGGQDFLDPAIGEVLAGLADAASTGALLLTCRYPLPGPDLFLAGIALPPLSRAELRRLFLRLPALRELDASDRALLTRTIGGHPRLIEFTDALLRDGRASLMQVQLKLRDLAHHQGIDLTEERTLQQAADQAMVLGSADILLTELLALLTDRQHAVLLQVAVCRAPMTPSDLHYALTTSPGASPPEASQPDLAALRADVHHLAGLTLLAPGDDVAMHPWTADLITRNTTGDLTAQHQRALAMRYRRFEQQRGSYSDLIDIPRHLAALNRYDDVADLAAQAIQVLPGTLATIACLAEIRPLIPPGQRAWWIVADLEARAFLSAGDLPAATRQQQAIYQQVQARADTDPANNIWQYDLAITHERLGDLAVAAGDLTAARTSYQACRDIALRLTADDPTNTGWQRELSVSHNKLGDLATAAGDLTAARTAYQTALAIRERLAAADPTNTQWQRDLAVSHERLGDLAAAAGDTAAARTAHQAALAIRERLAAADPTNTQWQRDLSVSHNKVGDLATAAGDTAAARTAHQAALAIAERLAAADPANTGWERDLSVSHERLGDLATAAGDTAAARTAHQAALAIRERLAATDPTNTEWQRDLSISHNRLGDLATAAGDTAAARTAYQAALAITERLAATDPTNTQWQRDLSISHNRLGDLAAAAGDTAAARTAYQADLAIAERLAATDPTNTGWQRDLSISHEKLGDLATAAGDTAAARTAYQAALAIAERLAATDPTNTEWQQAVQADRQKITDLP